MCHRVKNHLFICPYVCQLPKLQNSIKSIFTYNQNLHNQMQHHTQQHTENHTQHQTQHHTHNNASKQLLIFSASFFCQYFKIKPWSTYILLDWVKKKLIRARYFGVHPLQNALWAASLITKVKPDTWRADTLYKIEVWTNEKAPCSGAGSSLVKTLFL